MREIKFRAWDKDRKKMRYNVLPWVWDFAIEGGMWKCTKSHDQDGYAKFEVNAVQCDGNNLMQYTGLKDKNGKEIYEGDVLNFSNGYQGIVVYDNEDTSYFCKPINSGGDESWLSGVSEVIGNIYENPELLGGD